MIRGKLHCGTVKTVGAHQNTRLELRAESMGNHELFDFLRESSKNIQAEYDRITKRSREDPGTAGDEGEENWRLLLQRWLPPGYRVVTKGRILFQDGKASPQMDVLVLSPEYPRGLVEEGKKLHLAGGVLAAFECKLTARREHITKLFESARALSGDIRNRWGSPYRELHRPMIYGLPAHSHAWKSDAPGPEDAVGLGLREELRSQTHPREMPDLFCVSDLGTWSALKYARRSTWQIGKGDRPMPGPIGREDVGTLYCRRILNDGASDMTNVGAMVIEVLYRLAWERTELRKIANYFRIAQGPTASLGSEERIWEVHQIFSPMLVQELARGDVRGPDAPPAVPTDHGAWNEWSWGFGPV